MKTRNLKTVLSAFIFIFAIVASFAFTTEKDRVDEEITGYIQEIGSCVEVQVNCSVTGSVDCTEGFDDVYEIQNGTICQTKLRRE